MTIFRPPSSVWSVRRQLVAYRVLALLAIALAIITGPPAAHASDADAPRLFELQPFDQIKLKDESVIKVTPVEFPGGRSPGNLKPGDVLTVRLTDKPTEEYELHWRDVAEFKRFDQLILDEAERLVTAGKLAEAFAYFDFLERNHPTLGGLKAAIEKYLFEDASDCLRRKKYDEALAVLDELYLRNPSYAGLDQVCGAATDKVVESVVAREDFLSARQRLFHLQSRFPAEPSGLKWQRQLESQCAELVTQARSETAAGRLDTAQMRVFAALDRWPRDKQARQLALELFAQSPLLTVAVTQALPKTSRDPLTGWASRRASRLLTRSLMELSGYGAEGGVYRCTLGKFSVAELGLQLNVALRPEQQTNGGNPLTGYELSQYLVHAIETQPDSLLAQLIDRVMVRNVYDVDIGLLRPHMRPEALLSHPIELPEGDSDQWQSAPLAPFRLASHDPAQARYAAGPLLLSESYQGPAEIIERAFASVAAATAALARGEVLMIDRLNPWDVAALGRIEGAVVEPYAAPTVHVLVPNLKHPLLARRPFRRALVYGINRQAILDVQLLRGQTLPDTRVTSGPFPVGYAYNDRVDTRPYEPLMAMTLAQIARKELTAEAQPPAQPPAQASPSPPAGAAGDDVRRPPPAATDSGTALRLAHPPTEVARLACRAIQRQLKLVGIPTELVELSTESVAAAVDRYELVYAELQLEEPLTDARRLFGAGGIAGGSSPHLEQALVQLEAASDWKSARDELHRIHQIAADDVAIIPLWQLREHLAYRDTVTGIPSRPVTLYQDMGNWRIKPYLPPVEP